MVLFYVALGGAIGSVLRYVSMSFISGVTSYSFPYGTLFVNIVGSFLMGFFVSYLVKTLPHSIELRAFITVGLLGGFTTFSAFSLDAINLLNNGRITEALCYILISVTVSILALWLGSLAINVF